MTFQNRSIAGQLLTHKLTKYHGSENTVVVALPRGGVPVAFEIAKERNLPLDIVVPRKIGAPGNPEFAIGAIDETGEGVFNEAVIAEHGIERAYIQKKVEKEKAEAERRLKKYRGEQSAIELTDKTVLIVDDGIATGSTMRVAIKSVKRKGASKIIVAVPVSARDTLEEIEQEVDEVLCLKAPLSFGAVGSFYQEFGQTSDEEVIALIQQANE